MKLIVAGGRDFIDTQMMITVLMDLVEKGKIDPNPELVCGMARGADILAFRLWKSANMQIHVFPAEWDTYGKSAGFRRNKEMGEFADAAVCFWDGKSKGTKHMIYIMNKLNKPVYVVRY